MVIVAGNKVKDKTGREGKVIQTAHHLSQEYKRVVVDARVEWSDGSQTSHFDVGETEELVKL